MKETIVQINNIINWLFEKIKEIDKLLARPIKKKKKKNRWGGSNQQN